MASAISARKVRWQRAGSGKRSGVRVIYFNLTRSRPTLAKRCPTDLRRPDLVDELETA
ncbi:MAG: hypothetical protein WCY32_05650 [Burkholderiaceae bacterium]